MRYNWHMNVVTSFVFVGQTLNTFEFKANDDFDFPPHDGGRVIFQRDQLVEEIVQKILLKKQGRKFGSYYWRAPFGSGKTVFLKLMGQALTNQGCVVYMTSGNEMDEFHKGYFNDLAKRAGDITMVLLVDEVQNNLTSKHWLDLLKGSKPRNLLVLGVGVAHLGVPAPPFDERYPENGDKFPMFFTEDDLPELSARFSKMAEVDVPELSAYFRKMLSRYDENVITEVCKSMLEFTAGHPFSFVKFMEHVVDPENYINLKNIDKYIYSKEFSTSDVYEEVIRRSFPSILEGDTQTKGVNVMLNKENPKDESDLDRLGLWSWSNDYFISPLVISELFWKHDVSADVDVEEVELKDPETMPYAQQVISAGLRDMKEEHFTNVHYQETAVENAVRFRWGFNVKACLPDVWIAPQLSEEQTGRRRKPKTDFFVNGRMDMGIALALNVDMTSLDEHLGRFDNKYKRYENGALFHLDTKNESPLVPKLKGKHPVYTFLKKENALYCNSDRVQSNVSRFLPSPPARSYSTHAVGFLKSALKRIK
jgi:hypothetical protein